jgi:hypothetical protein
MRTDILKQALKHTNKPLFSLTHTKLFTINAYQRSANRGIQMTQLTDIQKIKTPRGFSRYAITAWPGIVLGSATTLLLLSACASAPVPPTAALQAAEIAIANADQARVADYSIAELGEAREKLTAARSAVQKEDMVLAQRLAEQSLVDAQLALAKADVAKANTVNNEMKQSTRTLKQEMQRKSGDTQ